MKFSIKILGIILITFWLSTIIQKWNLNSLAFLSFVAITWNCLVDFFTSFFYID